MKQKKTELDQVEIDPSFYSQYALVYHPKIPYCSSVTCSGQGQKFWEIPSVGVSVCDKSGENPALAESLTLAKHASARFTVKESLV